MAEPVYTKKPFLPVFSSACLLDPLSLLSSVRLPTMAATASPPAAAPPTVEPSSSQGHRPRPSVATSWDSEALRRYAERCETESEAFVDPVLLPTLEDLLQDLYTSLQPQPVDYEHRQVMINVFNKIAEQIFGKKNGLPVVEPFGSFTMDLFTAKSDLDLSVNFNTDINTEFSRKDKISAIRRLAKILHRHQRNGRCYGVLPIVTAIVPVLKVIDQGTGVECDISVENKDGMSRSMIFKSISSIDERFRILCYLMKFWAKSHGINSPKDRTISSMAIISLVAFHLQTRHPPILPAFSAILKDGSDFASIERNVSLYKGFGSRNKESIAELFVSLMSKLVSVERLWEQGLCASNFEGSWISKTWDRGVGNLSVEDFMDRSQNFARSVGKEEMQIICECLRVTVSSLSNFFMGNIDAPKLKAFLFGPLQESPMINASQKNGERKRVNPNKMSSQKNAKRRKLDQDKTVTPPIQNDAKKKKLDQDKPVAPPIQNDAKKKKFDQYKPITPLIQKDAKKKLDQDKRVTPIQKDEKKKSIFRPDLGNSHVQQKKSKLNIQTGHPASGSRPANVFIPPQMHQPVPTQPSTPLLHNPQQLFNPSYGLPRPQLHPAYHPYLGLVSQPQGNSVHFNHGIQLQHQGQVMFSPSSSHHPVMDRLHPYGINDAHQVQHYDSRFIQRPPPPPYGIGPSFWR